MQPNKSITELKGQIMSFGRTYTEIQALHDAADALIAVVQSATVARCLATVERELIEVDSKSSHLNIGYHGGIKSALYLLESIRDGKDPYTET